MSVFIGNLPYEVSQDDLKRVFEDYGTVKSVRLPTDRETGRLRGFAFVEMDSEAEETKAISELDGAEWIGRTLKVSKAKPRDDKRPPRGDRGERGGGERGERGGNNRYQQRRY